MVNMIIIFILIIIIIIIFIIIIFIIFIIFIIIIIMTIRSLLFPYCLCVATAAAAADLVIPTVHVLIVLVYISFIFSYFVLYWVRYITGLIRWQEVSIGSTNTTMWQLERTLVITHRRFYCIVIGSACNNSRGTSFAWYKSQLVYVISKLASCFALFNVCWFVPYKWWQRYGMVSVFVHALTPTRVAHALKVITHIYKHTYATNIYKFIHRLNQAPTSIYKR